VVLTLGFIEAFIQIELESLKQEKTTREENAETRKGLFLIYNTIMTNKYFQGNKLSCDIGNDEFVAYLNDLKTLFESVKSKEESGDLDGSKDMLMDEFGKYIPNIYNVQKELRNTLNGKYADNVTEIVLRYNELHNILSDESINFLTENNVEITRNRIKLFLMQQIRDIESILS